MDGQYLSHSSSYAYGSEEWPEFYDLWVESLLGTGPCEDIPVFRSALKRHVAECNGVHTINVVDIGTGTGRVIKDLWQEPNGTLKEVSFWGLDNAQAMLDRAKLTFGVPEATHRSESTDGPARLLPIWVQAPAADFISHLPELVGKADLILFAAGGIGHLTADDEVTGFLTQVRQALRLPEHSGLARAVISVLHEMIPEKNPDLAVEQRRGGTGLPSGEALDGSYKIPSRDHTGLMYSKSPTVSQWSHDVRTDSFTIKIVKHRAGQEGEVSKEKDVAWSLRIFDEKAFKDAVEKSGLRIEEVREGETQRWYFLALSGA